MTDTELFGIEPPQEAVNIDGLRDMFCAIIARSVSDARTLRKSGHITDAWKVNFPRTRKGAKPIRLLGYYTGASAVQDLVNFMKFDLSTLLSEAGLGVTSQEVMADIDMDCMGERCLPPCEFVWGTGA